MKAVLARLTILAILTSSACGDDAAPAAPSDDLDPSSAEEAGPRDAGKVRDARADAKASTDSGKGDVVGLDEDTGVQPEDGGPMMSDASSKDASVKDAGLTNADAGASSDAGRPTKDAGTGSVCDTLNYASFGQNFMANYCVSCHGSLLAQKNIHLDTLAGVSSAKSKTKSEVSKNAMPPFGSPAPTSAERMQLTQWIDCGPK